MDKDLLPFWKNISGGYIKLPKDLFRNEKYQNVSPTGKLLYGFLVDRASLSATKGDSWKTETGEIYVVYTIQEIMTRMQCGHDKASKVLKELEGVGLISRSRKKRSQAYHIVVHPVLPTAEKCESNHREMHGIQCEKTDVNNTDNNNPDEIDINLTTYLQTEECRKAVEKQISYNVLMEMIPKEYVECCVSVIVETICSKQSVIKVNGAMMSAGKVRERLLNVTDMDIRYVYERMQHEHYEIQYVRGYILARLMEDEAMREVFYDQWVTHDEKQNKDSYKWRRY